MQIITTAKSITEYVEKCRAEGKTIGFVPTMGALHKGHLSLITQSMMQNDITICSIFVNPTQFNEPDDFQNYPRTIDTDKKQLENLGCDVLFLPTTNEIYPIPDTEIYNLGPVSTVLEGALRPGHFNGVASVVKRLFELVKPDNAYFGLKDYQQYLVIKELVKNYGIKVNVVGCDILREKTGLAMSSRNGLLTRDEMNTAAVLYNSLETVKAQLREGNSIESAILEAKEYLKPYPVTLEYLEIRKKDDLSLPGKGDAKNLIALVAARVKNVRLIDNLFLN